LAVARHFAVARLGCWSRPRVGFHPVAAEALARLDLEAAQRAAGLAEARPASV